VRAKQGWRITGVTFMIRPFRSTHPQIHESAFIEESAQIIGDVHIGEQSSVWFNAVVRGDVFYIRIGDRTNIQDGTVVHVTNGTHATILEDEVTVGHNATLHGCYIERGCLVGMGSIVMDDVRVGAQSLIAAGSLLSPGTRVPPRSLVMGSPAKVKRPLTPEEVASLDVFWKNYIEYTKVYKQES
jgi:carbonic anhydrase/acetyltransferase-like protein (isoleucine patch superfamily)